MSDKTTRCKFVCVSETKRSGSPEPTLEYEFHAVTHGSPENESFFRWTPNGKLTLGVVRSASFEVGKEYYLDIAAA